ncbi:MAG: lipopolysaccharide heptosyltransferase I [Magnetococcales bacterium]|nr:lipopolysaccharide heptosyltransferase I [Magnetococcales bacterium]
MKQRVLLVKTSSLGDLIHLLPALSDARQQRPELRFHWLLEESFAEVASWHPAVERVIPVALRRWRRHPWSALRSGELGQFWREVRAEEYHAVIDAQGLIKSACMARLARGRRIGLDWQSAREPWASWLYQKGLPIATDQHAVVRLRQLLAAALEYPLPRSEVDYGLAQRFPRQRGEAWIFIQGTTWPSKQWPEQHWRELARLVAPHGPVLLPWGTVQEEERARRIAQVAPDRLRVAPKGNLTQLALLLASARGVVAVDSGPAHLAAALGVPVVGLYGPTNPQRTGTMAPEQQWLQGACPEMPCLKKICPLGEPPPCYAHLDPERVWSLLQRL